MGGGGGKSLYISIAYYMQKGEGGVSIYIERDCIYFLEKEKKSKSKSTRYLFRPIF